MSGFSDPILTGDGSLIRPAAKSPNFVTAATGWSIDKDGSAEFNNATIRGQLIASLLETQLTGRRIVIDGTGPNFGEIFFYSGSPTETEPGRITVGGSSGSELLTITAPKDASMPDPVYLSLTSGGIFGALLELVSPGQLTVSSAGRMALGSSAAETVISSGTDVQLTPTSGVVSLPAGVKIHRGGLATPTLLNGWTPRGTVYAPPQYAELPDHTGMLSGAAAPGTLTGGTVLFVLPAAVRPAAHHSFECPASAGGSAMIQVESTGNVTIWNPTAGITWVAMSGCIWPIAGF